MVGYGRDWQVLWEDCTHRDFNLSRHVPDVVSQQRTDHYDPMVPGEEASKATKVQGPR